MEPNTNSAQQLLAGLSPREIRRKPRAFWQELAADMLRKRKAKYEAETAAQAEAGGVAENRAKRARDSEIGASIGTGAGVGLTIATGGLGAPLAPLLTEGGRRLGDLAEQKNLLGSGSNLDLFRETSPFISAAAPLLPAAAQLNPLIAAGANWDQIRRFAKEPGKRFARGGEKLQQNYDTVEKGVKSMGKKIKSWF